MGRSRFAVLAASALPIVIMACLMLAAGEAKAERRLALVIGNGAYRHTGQLANPPRDAHLLTGTLRSVGFTVTEVIDADAETMKRAMLEFGRSLRGSDAVGLFFYAGHGLQVNGHNYLVPVSANITDETEAAIEAVSLSELLATMERAQTRVNIVVLDACRNNPFARSFRSGQQGLARVDAPTGSFVAYATAPGSVAADGTGSNSPYTQALAGAMRQPGLAIEQVFKEVRRSVLKTTSGKQVPWDSTSLTGDFYFMGGPASPASRLQPAPAEAADDKALDLAFWNAIKDEADPALVLSYLQQFPRGTFVAPAQRRLIELKAVSALASQQPPTRPGAPAGPGPSRWREAIPSSSRRDVTPADLATLDCERLWIARNELFARNGYCFGSERGKQVFGTAGCTTSDQNILTALEKANLLAIKAEEQRRACTAEGAATYAPPPPPSRNAGRYYLTGLDPNGDNYLSLRTKPGAGGREIRRMGPQTRLEVIARQGPWLQVRLDDGSTGWAFGKYIACCR